MTWEKGIFCANSGHVRGGFAHCEGVWCDKCFTPHPLDPATVAIAVDFNGQPLTVPEDNSWFMCVREDDHTLTAFQCSLCQYRNIKWRDLTDSWQDQLFTCQIMHSTINAFWARAAGTFAGHKNEVQFQIRYGKALQIAPLLRLGPWPLGENVGMKTAITLECRAMENGTKGRVMVTYATARKARTVHTNVWSASPCSGAGVSFSSAKSHYFATQSPSQSQWFEHFTKGLHIRTGVMT